MKKTSLIILCFLVLAQTASLGQHEPLANADRRGLYVRSIEQVLRLHPEEVDLATAALIISERWSKNVYGRRYLQKLDDMASEIRDRLRAKRIPLNYRAIPVINKYLFDEHIFAVGDLVKRFSGILPFYYTSILRILTICPGITSKLMPMLSRINRLFRIKL